ncbi:MAG: hypothetical protein LBO74_00335 [Candidatus Symbiothrix sp.]|jgi:hypothetical protein|nr:hypothetical protein [Candidatus Symbiothrix sp.]
MKKVILILLVAVSGAVTANAQFTKGTKTLGLKTNFGLAFNDQNFGGYNWKKYSYGNKREVTGISFTNPRITGSYFVLDKLAITTELGYSAKNVDFMGKKYSSYYGGYGYGGYECDNSFSSIDFSIGGKYYFWKNIFGGLSVQSSTLIDYGTMLAGGTEIGATFYIKDKIFIEPAISIKYFNDMQCVDNNHFEFALPVSVGFKF